MTTGVVVCTKCLMNFTVCQREEWKSGEIERQAKHNTPKYVISLWVIWNQSKCDKACCNRLAVRV